MFRLLVTSVLALATVAACAGGEVNLLGGREKCWNTSQPRIASLMKGWLELDTTPTVLHTLEGESLDLMFSGLKIKSLSSGDYALVDQAGTQVGSNGEVVTVFGGLGSDGAMVVCSVEEHHDG